jgi:hypothetical protein
MVTLILGTLVWTFILQHLGTLAQSVAQNVASEDFKKLVAKFSIGGKIKSAVERAYQRFHDTLRDPDLLTALAADGGFTSSPDAARVLAQAALIPQERDRQVSQLGAVMRTYAPQMALVRCESAARLLIEEVHKQISGISALREGLQALELQRVREQQQQPPYAPGLYQRIEDEARAIERRLAHGYVSTGHLLYAIMAQPRSVAAWTLGKLDVSMADVRDALGIIRPQTDGPPDRLSEGTKAALTRARELARTHGAIDTETEHVLLALAELALGGGPLGTTIRAIFLRLGLDPQRIYDRTASVTQARGAIESAVMSFYGAGAAESAPNHAANGGANGHANGHDAKDADLPIDARETLRNFGI